MTSIVITVAGESNRFNEGHSEKRLKAIFYEHNPKETILYQLLDKVRGFDQICIVGGYSFTELNQYINSYVEESLRNKIEIVYNEDYQTKGSGYSLYLGLKEVLKQKRVEEVLFVEGDLDVDYESFSKVISAKKNVFTYNNEVICSNKAVVAYTDVNDGLHYIYSIEHGCLKISIPFKQIFNSGQCWKFINIECLKQAMHYFAETCLEGTNLVLIQNYFDRVSFNNRQAIGFKRWMNCNTREDYVKAREGWRKENESISK